MSDAALDALTTVRPELRKRRRKKVEVDAVFIAGPTEPDPYQSWYSKSEVMRLLRCAERSIDRKVDQGLIEKRDRFKAGRRPEPVYNPSDVDGLAAAKPMVMREAHPGNGTSHRPEIAPPAISQAAALLKELLEPAAARILESLSLRQIASPANNAPAVPAPLWLSIDEASVYSGLSRGRLKRFVREGQLPAVRQKGGMKVRRADLEELTANDFTTCRTIANSNATTDERGIPPQGSSDANGAAMVRRQPESKGPN